LTITARPAPNAAPARLKVRKSIDSLSAQELADFRRAVKQAVALNDKRGFDYFASWHGVPFGWCQHHDALFRPWHRAYLYWLELALQSQVPGVTLPWWDWSKETTIPSAHSVAQAGGEANVLAKAPIKAFNTAHPARRHRRVHRDRARVQQERRYRRRAPVQGADAAHLRMTPGDASGDCEEGQPRHRARPHRLLEPLRGLMHRRRGRLPVLPARMHGDQPRGPGMPISGIQLVSMS
jgi:hypothetical protein